MIFLGSIGRQFQFSLYFEVSWVTPNSVGNFCNVRGATSKDIKVIHGSYTFMLDAEYLVGEKYKDF